jgi:hypothetical protein
MFSSLLLLSKHKLTNAQQTVAADQTQHYQLEEPFF